MNNQTRKQLSDLIEKLEEVFNDLESMSTEEREKFDNLPEGLQASEMGEALSESADMLEEQVSNLQNVIDELSGLA